MGAGARRAVLVLALTLGAAPGLGSAPAPAAGEPDLATLRRLFQSPPDDSRILMRWWWFGSAVTKAGIEREMRLMKEGGIGGFEVQAVYPVALDDPGRGLRNLPFLSDEFIEALRFAADQAREMGLRIDLTVGSGWPYGGPRVPITQAAGKLRVERSRPAAGSRRVPLPDVGAGEELIAAFLGRLEGGSIAPASLRELSDVRDGAAWLPAGLEGPHEALFFVASRTGMMVKRPAVGAEGFVVDHYDRAALDHYLAEVGDRLMQAFGPRPPYAVFCDSLEVFDSDWTADFLDEFRRRRGYDLRPHLPALVADVGPGTPGLRHDWGRTLTELLDERFLAPMREWARRHGTRFRVQGYGIPPATIASNAHADLPEGEGYQWKALRASRWASSASHLYGRPVTSSETWTWLHSPSFRAAPLDLKAEADLHFLQGINQLIGHGWPYTAQGVEYPGWRFYAAGAFNEKNPWWIVMPDLALYLQRLSFLMRQGQPVNDVALYLPNADAWSGFVSGKVHYMIEALRRRIGDDVVARVLEAGFNLDFFDDDVLRQLGRVEEGALVLGANRYRAVVLPNVERIPLETLRRLEEFARAGGVLVATRRRPDAAPGFRATEKERAAVRELAARLFPASPAGRGGAPPTGAIAHLVEDEDHGLGPRLAAALRPDVSLSPPSAGIGFVHRRTATADLYFVANTSNVRVKADAALRDGRPHAEWWDPLTGDVQRAEARPGPRGGRVVTLDLEPYGSRVLVFASEAGPAAADARPPSGSGRPDHSTDLGSGWTVTFGPGGPSTRMDTLRSWTDDEATRHFSGVATYEREVDVPEGMLGDGAAVRLELGQGTPVEVPGPGARMRAWLDGPVREAAVVHVNDRRAGSVWCPPYRLDVTRFLRPGTNRLRISVGNLALNHMAGRSPPDRRLLSLRYGVRFEDQDTDQIRPVPAGLLGPIRLVSSTGASPGRQAR